MNKLFTLLITLLAAVTCYGQIYISTDGNDTNTGTIGSPLATITAALNKVQAGDTIYMRGGTYSLSVSISLSKKGTADNKYHLFSYNNEKVLLDFSSMAFSSSNRGIRVSGNYWFIKGLDIKGAGDNGMNISGSYNTIELCSFFENRDTGLQLGGGASENRIINCDSYFNADPGNGNADGFAPKLDVGTNNYFYGCRAWQNSDDGWDGYLRGADDVSTIIENCWCFANGYLKDGSASTGNGNGYKMGGGDNTNSLNLAHDVKLINSIAFDNRVKGFDQNNNRGSMIIQNGTAYRNGTNYSISAAINSDESAVIVNSAVMGLYGSLAGFVSQQTNSWQTPFTVTADDFASLDTTGVRGERNSDGSLPNINFLHLSWKSELINAGTDIGLPYIGTSPDIGAFEFDPALPVELISMSAEIAGTSILLKWTTATETNNNGFEIQVSGKDKIFYTTGFVRGAGTVTEQNEYMFEDKNPPAGVVYYRIKQVDFDGSYSYSGEIELNNTVPGSFTLSQNYPNPFNPATSINFNIPAGHVSLKVYDILGNEAASLINEEKEAGAYNIIFNAASLSSGVYYYKLKVKGLQGNFEAVKKMIMIK